MLEKYLRPGVSKPRILKLLQVIGELKAVDFPTLKTVKNPITEKVATKKLIDCFLTDKLLELTEKGNVKITVKSIELLKKYKYRTKHIIKNPKDSNSEHSRLLREFLLPFMFEKEYHGVFYTELKDHRLRPDACLVFSYSKGYKIQFVEVENTEKDAQYLLEKNEKYKSLGGDINTWDSWWRRWSKILDLDFCEKERFCFSVICKGNKTFEQEGWKWV